MRLRVLGSAAGGGSPQWNCRCPTCRVVRYSAAPSRPRTQSSIAVSADGDRWFLVNASPDVRAQIEATPALHPRDDRATPLSAVLLTDGEIDHTLGLLLLREGRGVTVHATAPTLATLQTGTAVLATLERYCPVHRHVVEPGVEVPLAEGLTYRAVDVPTTKPSRFAGSGTGTGTDGDDQVGRVIGYRFTDTASGRFAVYLPGVQRLTEALRAEIDGAEVLLLDGTCWHDDELARLGLADKTAHDMGHMAMGGPDGSLEALPGLGARRTVFVHINNTNPVLVEDSPQRRIVDESGAEIGFDGMEVEIGVSTPTTVGDAPAPDTAAFLDELRAQSQRYHSAHPFHVAMNAGDLRPEQIRGWVANRFHYQQAIPRKDAAILANCPDVTVRQRWIRRIVDHDGDGTSEGGIEAWLRLGEACGVPRGELLDQRHLAPGVRFAVDAYLTFARDRPWVEAVASSLTELFAPDLMGERLAAFEKHYTWIDSDGLAYFRNRLVQAPRDSEHALEVVTEHCRTPEQRAAAVAALSFKNDVLWSMMDAIEKAYPA